MEMQNDKNKEKKMYEGLLLSTGGGIITDREKSEQQGEPTIIIGLGGTGIDALKVVKKKVYEQLYPDNPGGEIPEYRHIGFLAIDTDDISNGEDSAAVYSLRKNECLSISVNDVTGKMRKDIDAGNKEFNWLQEDIELLSEKGAGTVRQVGRYCLFKNIDKIKSGIEKLKEIVTRDTTEPNVNVHIIAGISGGTGSGTFIDMCYIVRDLLGTDAALFGYFFMPDVNLFKTGIDAKVKDRIRGNGYAALKELDYTMNLGNEGKRFSQLYGGQKIYSVQETSRPPVDLCHLVSATGLTGTTVTNGYTYSMNIVGEYILSYLAKVEDFVADDVTVKGLTLAGHLANVNALTGTIKKKHGETLNYHILGASVAELPTREIGTYLATELYKKLEEGLVEKKPKDADVIRHADAMDLKFSRFKGKLWDKIMDANAGIDWDSDDFSIEDILNTKIIANGKVVEDDTDDSSNVFIRRKILGPARKWEADSKGKLEGNFEKLTKDLDDFKTIGEGETVTTLISQVFQYLQNKIVSDFGYGAVYASKITHNEHGYSLNDRLSEIIKTAVTEKEHCESDRDARVRDIIETVKECRERTKGVFIFGPSKKTQEYCIKSYKDAIRAYFQNEFDIEVCEKIKNMADKLQGQIDRDGYPNSLYPKYFKPLENMLLKLKATFKKNSEYFEALDDRNDEFVWKIVEFKDVKGLVDYDFKSIVGDDVSKDYKSFVSMLMAEHSEWTSNDVANIEHMISTYMQKLFETLLGKAMEDYLKIKYNIKGDPETLKEKIREDLLEEGVLKKAQPKFHIDTTYEISPAVRHVLNVPKTEQNVCAAAKDIAAVADENSPLDFRCTGLGNKIFAVKFESGIPLYVYGLIDELEKEYNSGGVGAVGRHLYEITGRNKDIDWANLQSFIPYSIDIKHKACADGKELEQLYHVAVSKGIIAENKYKATKYDVYELNAPAIKEKDDFMKEGRIDMNELNSYVEKLKSYTDDNGKLNADNDKNIKGIKPLLSDGSVVGEMDYRETCRIDYFVRFRGLQEVVKESMRILDDVEEAIKEAAKWQNEGAEREETIKLITNALCFGFFKGENEDSIYTYNDVVLFHGGMDYSKFPVYQIYKTFISDAFADAEREKLKNDVTNKFMELKAADKERAEAIKARYIDDARTGIVNAMKQAAVHAESGDIETVYKLFEREVQALLNLF